MREDSGQLLSRAQGLAADIAAAVRHAARSDDLAQADEERLFRYALGITLFFARARGNWSDADTEAVLGAAGGDQGLRERSLGVMEDLDRTLRAGGGDGFLDFATLHLMETFPGAAAAMAEGRLDLMGDMVQAFGKATLDGGMRPAPQPAESAAADPAPAQPPQKQGWLKRLFG